MLRQFRMLAVFFLFASTLWSQTDSVYVKFMLARFDYQTMESKHLYYYHQPLNPSPPEIEEQLNGEVYVDIKPAGDFGSTLIRSRATGDTVYYATTVWDGTGKHYFPPPEYEIDPNGLSKYDTYPKRLDVVDYFFNADDSAKVDAVLHKAMNYAALAEFGNEPYNALIYLHYFSVGVNDPTTAEWIALFYTLPKESPLFTRKWVNISGNLGKSHIMTIAPLSYVDSLMVGTTQGAFSTHNGGMNWNIVKFDKEFKTGVSVIENCWNPYVMLPAQVNMTYLGTTDFTMIPEDRNGRIYRRMVDGAPWENLKFPPNIAITAIGIDPVDPAQIYVGAHNPFYQKGGLFRFHPKTGWQKLFPFEEDKTTDRCKIRINCIAIDPADTSHIYIGTGAGLYFTRNYGMSWEHRLHPFNVVSIVIPDFQSRTIFAATSGTSRSDGIYRSDDGGDTWTVQHWRCNIVDLILCSPIASDPWNMFMAVYNEGVFVSDYDGRRWNDITGNLRDLKITALALDKRDLHGLYVGTESAIYKYKHATRPIDLGVYDNELAHWPPAPKENDIVKIYADIHNHSRIPIRNVEVAFNLGNDSGFLTPINIITLRIIPPDTFVTVNVKWKGRAGKHHIFVHVDPRNTIREINEGNNRASIEIWVEPAVSDYRWHPISGNLPDLMIHDISTHPFYPHQIFIGTDAGAYVAYDATTQVWEELNFCNDRAIKVTQIASEAHPFLDWTVPVVYVGTEEKSTIPENILSRIFRSEDGGIRWWDTGFMKKMMITTLNVSPWNSLTAYAGAWSPSDYKMGLFVLQDSLWRNLAMVYGDNKFFKINCIEVDHHNQNILYIGTGLGFIKITTTDKSHAFSLMGFNIVSIVQSRGERGVLYAASGGRSKSDGVYLSKDGGEHWEVIHWHTNIVEICPGSQSLSSLGHLYLAAYDDGVYASHDGGQNWQAMNEGLYNKKVTSLAIDRYDPRAVYLGTEKGVYMYVSGAMDISHALDFETPEIPAQFELSQNYPNPFNQQTVFSFGVPQSSSTQKISLKIFNLLGQEVKLLFDGVRVAGIHKITWDGTNSNGQPVDSGVYFCRLCAGVQVMSRKLVLVR